MIHWINRLTLELRQISATGRSVFALLDDERLLRDREIARLHPIPLRRATSLPGLFACAPQAPGRESLVENSSVKRSRLRGSGQFSIRTQA